MTTTYKCFPGGKHKVLTMSYDDGREEDRKLIEIFNKYGIKGTFNVNAGIKGDPRRIPQSEYKELYKGHEIACHTYTHPTIERCNMEQVIQQVLQDRKELEALVGYPVKGLAYPNGSYSPDIMNVLPYCGIEYGRIVGDSKNFAMPKNWHEWKATCHHSRIDQLGEQFINLNKKQYLYMMYVWGHSYEFSNNTPNNNWDIIENFCKLVGGRDDIWYATNIEIVNYMKVMDNLQFSVAGTFVYNPSAQSAWLSVGGEIVEVKGGETVTLNVDEI